MSNWYDDIIGDISESGFGSMGKDLGGFLFGNSVTDNKTGITTEEMGAASPILKGLELFQRKGALEDTKEYRDRMLAYQEKMGMSNLLMSRDAYNRKANQRGAVLEQAKALRNGGNATDVGKIYADRAQGGSIINPDGSSYNIVDVDPKYSGTGYTGAGQPAAKPTATPASGNPKLASSSKFARPSTAGTPTKKPLVA